MLILRALFLELLVCIHVIGAAVLFRRLFPRESAWMCFLIPTLGLVVTLNFVEHYIGLSNIGWLLPISLGGMIWSIFRPGYSWQGLRFPAILFVSVFSFIFLLKCLSPIIANYTEGVFNLTRVLNYCLSDTLPPKDCWLPPYDYGRYYTFQHYGASILKRLFSVDLGTAYNVSFSFLLTWLVIVGAGVAHTISGKIWIAISVVIVLLSGSTGSVPFLIFFGHNGADYEVATSINDCWNDQTRNPFWWLCAHDATHPVLKLLTPCYTIYYSEFHGNLGGAFVTIASMLAITEVFRLERSTWGWICLVAFPMMSVITSTWFFLIVAFLCGGSLVIALIAGRRPQDLKLALIGSAVALVCLWPSFYSLTDNPNPISISWIDPADHTPFWMFAVQWWPVWLPWLCLCFVWGRLNLMGRWIHAAIPLMYLWVEYFTIGGRGLTVEKMWGGIYGAGLVALLPLVFMQRNLFFRILSIVMVLNFTLCLGDWMRIRYSELDRPVYFRLQGDSLLTSDHQTKRILQVLRSMHGKTILPGKSYWDYNSAPMAVAFSENMCYVAYTSQEENTGNGEEARYRDALNNEFYAGKMADPLPFLLSNNISAVLIWPEDAISDSLLQQFQKQIGSDFYYINCKMDEPNNAGVFIRKPAAASSSAPVTPAPLDLSPQPPT